MRSSGPATCPARAFCISRLLRKGRPLGTALILPRRDRGDAPGAAVLSATWLRGDRAHEQSAAGVSILPRRRLRRFSAAHSWSRGHLWLVTRTGPTRVLEGPVRFGSVVVVNRCRDQLLAHCWL